LDIFGNR